jgi:hypothetical protein
VETFFLSGFVFVPESQSVKSITGKERLQCRFGTPGLLRDHTASPVSGMQTPER